MHLLKCSLISFYPRRNFASHDEGWGNFHRHVCRSSQVLTWFLPAVLNLFPKASDPPGLSKGMRLAIGLQGNENRVQRLATLYSSLLRPQFAEDLVV